MIYGMMRDTADGESDRAARMRGLVLAFAGRSHVM